VSNAKKLGFKPAVPWIHIRRRLYKDELPTTRELALEVIKPGWPLPAWLLGWVLHGFSSY